jgi:hypothetical protein
MIYNLLKIEGQVPYIDCSPVQNTLYLQSEIFNSLINYYDISYNFFYDGTT